MEDFEPVGVYTDAFGRVLETAICEYCQRTLPIKLWPNTLMRSYDYKGRIIWRCNDCAVDMINLADN